ncbi:N-terminal nucleophile aminohydrolase [Whalleya microplaca]|nr:N-terminal nucleophile aminohydrolase [Whalleya microplaca]
MDGMGMAWYTMTSSAYIDDQEGTRPALYKTQSPPTNDFNFRSLCANTESTCIFAHIRATSGSPVTPINNHPIVFGRHSFMHNGTVTDFARIRGDMTNIMAYDAYINIRGTTDTECLAALYVTFLTAYGSAASWQREYTLHVMKAALVRTVTCIMELQRKSLGTKATPNGLNLCATDGRKLVACRFRNHVSEQPASLYWSDTAGTTLNRKVPGDVAGETGTQYDVETVHSIFNSTPVAHVSFVPDPKDPKPVSLPMIARIGEFPESEAPACYLHGYVSARLFRARESPSSLDDDEGFPVCIAATKVDGLVLSLTPFSHGIDYRSAVVHGHAYLLDPKTDYDEVLWAMQLITDGIVPQRWEHTRTPPDAAEMASTRILKVRIDAASAKVHDTGLKEKEKDLADEKTRDIVWTGVIPYMKVLGAPQPADTNRVSAMPSYIGDYILTHNAGNGQAGCKVIDMISGLLSWIFGRTR